MPRFDPPSTPRRARRLRTTAALALVTLLALVAVGCSTPSAGSDVASLSDSSGTTPSSESEGSTDPEEAMRQFAQCMREHGIEMADPSSGSGGALISKSNGNSEAMDAADAACRHFMDDVALNAESKMDPAEEAKMKEQALAFAACMREHGIDLPDPQFNGDGKATQRMAGGAGSASSSRPDPESPAFQEAQKACEEFVPDGAITGSDSGDGKGPSLQMGAASSGGDQ